MPHFQVVLGGKWLDNAGAYGLASGAVPSKRIPEVVERITGRFVAERREDESFQDYTRRIGKRALREMFADLAAVPPHDEDPSFYSDWGDPREFTLGDMGVGECAGEVVSLTEFDLAAAEARIFEAQSQLEEHATAQADELAYGAMLLGARGTDQVGVHRHRGRSGRHRPRVPDAVLRHAALLRQVRGRQVRHVPVSAGTSRGPKLSSDAVHHLIEEAQLFLEACHACQARLAARPAAGMPAATEGRA